jgi:uncharacterized protein (TIGR03435 family)
MSRLSLPLAVIVVIAIAVPGQAQQPAPGAAPLPSFEAASIKPRDPKGIGAIDIRFFPNRFVATTVTLSQLIEQAYGIQARELVGGPDWVRVERFDVTATSGAEVSLDRMKLMLQSLLADRFQLEIARETRTGTIYRLTARNVRGLNPPAKPDERPRVSSHREDGKGIVSFHYDGHNATMADLVLTLSGNVRAPVLDETKLAGNYDFRVDYTYDSPYGGLEPDPNIPTIFTALERDLGLKLVADKGPVPVHVIRRVSKPSAN